jgi:hypothetical protein
LSQLADTLGSQKVASKAKRIETHMFEESKDYSDASIQHDPLTDTFAVQTDPKPHPIVSSLSVQTEDAEPIATRPAMCEMEIQTDHEELEASGSGTVADESLASSSSTIIPTTPKAHQSHIDLPPAYSQVTSVDQDGLAKRVADETLRKWHPGLELPLKAIPGGVSEDAIADWKALKAELGVECTAIDRIVEESARTGLPRESKDARRSRFYNIYNTYVYGGKGYTLLSTSQIMFVVGATAATAFLLGQAMTPHHSPFGAPVYYDRAAWSSFNSIQTVREGFPGDGSTAAFWSIIGRIGGGAARTLRGFPT